MANRDMSAELLAEIGRTKVWILTLVEMYLDSGTVYYAAGHRDVEYLGNTYLATGNLLKISSVRETLSSTINTATLTVSGVNQANISTALSEDYTDRRVKMFRLFETTDALLLESGDYLLLEDGSELLLEDYIGEGVVLYDGRIDSWSCDEDITSGTSTITWTLSSKWGDFDRFAGRKTNEDEQQIHFASDRGFEFASQIVKDLEWGRK